MAPGRRVRRIDLVDPKIIDDLARRISAAVPEGVRALQTDLEQNFRAALQAGLGRLDLVTREEFDVQRGVLQRTRKKLEALEARLQQLEKQSPAEDSGAED
jgi:BMFP domain-containing protein YqiC